MRKKLFLTSLLPLFFIGACATAAINDSVWLVVGASDSSAEIIAKKASSINASISDGLIFQTQDCSEAKNTFGWAKKASSQENAQRYLAEIKKVAPDAYIKPCNVKQGSLLDFNINVVDSSVANVSDDAVNWDDSDRVSSLTPVSDSQAVLSLRFYENSEDDPLEGRRTQVALVSKNGSKKALMESCNFAGQVVTSKSGTIAFTCVNEMAGGNMLNDLYVFNLKGDKVLEEKRCRNPQLNDSQGITCQAESVDSNGQLKLSEKKIKLTK